MTAGRALDNLNFFARLYDLSDPSRRIEHQLRDFDLWEHRDKPVGSFSKGMKQRLAIIRALFHEPRVLFLDEPTAGLDPESALEVRELIARLKTEGRTIVVCTHNLDEAERLADWVGILRQRLLAFDTLDGFAAGRAGAPGRAVRAGRRQSALAMPCRGNARSRRCGAGGVRPQGFGPRPGRRSRRSSRPWSRRGPRCRRWLRSAPPSRRRISPASGSRHDPQGHRARHSWPTSSAISGPTRACSRFSSSFPCWGSDSRWRSPCWAPRW